MAHQLAGWGPYLCIIAFPLFICLACSQTSYYSDQAEIKLNGDSTTESQYNYKLHEAWIKADSFYSKYQWDSALHHYEIVQNFCKRNDYFNALYECNLWLGRLHYYLAEVRRQPDNLVSAHIYLKQALQLQLKLSGHRSEKLWQPYFHLAEYFYNIEGNIDSSLVYLDSAKLQLTNRSSDPRYAQCLNLEGHIHEFLRYDYFSAKDSYMQAKVIFDGIDSELYGQYLTMIMANTYGLAVVSKNLHNYDESINYIMKLQTLMDTTTNSSLKSGYTELMHSVLGNNYLQMKRFDKAISELSLAIKANERRNTSLNNQVYYMDGLIRAYGNIGDAGHVDSIFRRVEELYLNKDLRDTLVFSETHFSYATTLSKTSNINDMLPILLKGQKLRKKILGDKHRRVSEGYRMIGEVNLEAGRPNEALKYFQSALVAGIHDFHNTEPNQNPTFAVVRHNLYLFNCLALKGRSWVALSEGLTDPLPYLNYALDAYDAADRFMTGYADAYDRENPRLKLAETFHSIYQQAVECAKRLYDMTGDREYLNKVFHFMEKDKSQILLEDINSALNNRVNKSNDEFAMLTKLKIDLDRYYYDLERGYHEYNSKEQLMPLRKKIEITKHGIDSVKNLINNVNPTYTNMSSEVFEYNLLNAQQYADSTNTCIVEFLFGDSTIYLLGIIPNQEVKLLKRSLTDSLQKTIEELNFYFYTSSVVSKQVFSNYVHNAHYAYKELLEPVIGGIQYDNNTTRMNLAIIGDGVLMGLPFEALLTDVSESKSINYQKLNYLLNDYVVATQFSCQLLFRSINSVKVITPNVLAVVDPDLEGAKKEADRIGQVFNNISVHNALDSKEWLRNQGDSFDILHFSIHGLSDTVNRYQSYLKLPTKSSYDSLFAYDVSSMSFLNSKLAVLSSCRTGIGKDYQGEGVYSMGRSFYIAGIPSVVMGLWDLGDRSYSSIINSFYVNLSKGIKISHALDAAKKDFVCNASSKEADPRNWAGLVLVGRADLTMQGTNSTNRYVLIVFILTVLALIALIYKSMYKLKGA